MKVFKQPNYLHNFVQSTFNALTPEKVKGCYFSIIISTIFGSYLSGFLEHITVPCQISAHFNEYLIVFCAGATLVVSGDGRYYSNDAVQV